MKLLLENGYEIEMPQNSKYNIFYGPNKIGKTQISYGLKNYYELQGENVLLFNDNIINNMIIQESNDINQFEMMPRIQEYSKHKKEFEKSQEKLNVKENLKKVCSVNTKKAFADFENISNYITDDAFFYKGEITKGNFQEDEIKELFKSKSGLYNFFEIIEVLKKGNIQIVAENIKKLVEYEIYSLQSKIVKNLDDYEVCPVCYSTLSLESIEKIKKSVENGSIDEQLKNSIIYYIDSKFPKISNMVNELLICNSYDDFKKNIIKDVENSIIYYLNNFYDSKCIDTYLNSKKEIEQILKEIKDFKLSENQDTYEYIKNKFKQHSVYKNTNMDVKIIDGKLQIINSGIEYSKMSKSEQNFFKFLYFDTLVYQKKQQGKLHMIVDDPFDSYDDIYIQDSIGIIVNLVDNYIGDIETINILSHSMYIIHLYDKISSYFKIFWLDQIQNKQEIYIYTDNYTLLKKVEQNPYDYGLILKISDKLVDKYSLIAFASLLRNEINMERLLMKKNTNTDTLSFYNKVESMYNSISDSISHIKSDIKIKDIADKVNEIFYFDLNDIDSENISLVMNDITSQINKIDIKVKTGSGNIKMIEKTDICYILIYKILLGLKIRRMLEEKAFNIVQKSYNEVGDLMQYLKNTPLGYFYNTYSYIINSFNHSSSKVVPPIFVYSIKTLQSIYDEIVAL